MKADPIIEISIDDKERLHIKPKSKSYEMIYREAAEVHWDRDGHFLYSPKPREWSYFDWFRHILSVADPSGDSLELTKDTNWISIPPGLKKDIQEWMNERKK